MKVCGLDVHKDTIFCALYNGRTYDEVKIFSTLTSGIRELSDYLHQKKVKKIAMESTGIYWVPIWNILEESNFELMLVNPYYIKQMPGRKSDIKDSQWIARLLYNNMLRPSFVPDKNIRELRSYTRKQVKLQKRRTSLLQELERILELCNIRITSFVSDIGSKSVREVVKLIIEGVFEPELFLEVIHGRILKKHKSQILESLQGFVPDYQRTILRITYDELVMVESHIEQLNILAIETCKKYYKEEMSLLKTIAGVSDISATQIIAESGSDMNAFADSKKYASWIGFTPRNDESAGKFKSRATTNGNNYLRRILVQISWCAVRVKDSYFNYKFRKLTTKKGPKKSLIAIARKIAVIIWNMLKTSTPFNPQLLPIDEQESLLKRLKYHKDIIESIESEFEKSPTL